MFSKKIKVLYPVLHYPPVVGGLEQWTQNIAEGHSEDIAPIVVTGKVGGEPKYENRNGAVIARTSLFSLKNLSYSSAFYITTALPFIFFKSFFIARSGGINIIHCQGFLSAIMGCLIGFLTAKPFIGTEQSVGWSRGFNGIIRGAVYKRAKICIASSKSVANEFKKIGVYRVVVIPNGVKMPVSGFNSTGSDPVELKILSVGRLEEVKGHKYLIDAFFKIKRDIPKARLILVGDGSEGANLKKQAQRLGLIESVDFIGEVNHDAIAEYFSKADLFVMPSLSEGFGIAALEAMAFGLPVVSSNVGGLKDIIEDGHNGLLVSPGNSDQIRNAIIKILTNKTVMESMSRNALALAKMYSWGSITKSVFAIYEQII